MTMEECLICTHPLQAQIEAEFVSGVKSINDIVAFLGETDILEVMVHFEDHPMALEKAAEDKQTKRRLKEVSMKKEERSEKSIDKVTPYIEDGTSSLTILEEMSDILQLKFNEVVMTKQAHGISQIAREIRETLKEIARVRKERKRTLADKTSELFDEHRAMTRWLLHNM